MTSTRHRPQPIAEPRVPEPAQPAADEPAPPGDETPGRVVDVLEKYAGIFTGMYPPGYLDELRDEWE